MATKKASARSASATRTPSGARRRHRAQAEPEPVSLFPTKLVLVYEDGSEDELPFADPVASAKGNLNAWAGNKFVRDGKMLRVNCNVTQVRG